MINNEVTSSQAIDNNINRALVMGILNITPDSFYSGSRFTEETKILKQVEKMLSEGMDIVDIGGMSTRPDCQRVTEQEESERIKPVIRLLKKEFPALTISIDTFRSQVAEIACAEGANIINDISGFIDVNIIDVIKKYSVKYILSHYHGDAEGKMQFPVYENVVEEIKNYFSKKIEILNSEGIEDIILDPCFGFSKSISENYKVMNHLDELHQFGYPLLVGVSRKTMIYKVLGNNAQEALNGTTVLNTFALALGASYLRVHDVKEAVEASKIIATLNENM